MIKALKMFAVIIAIISPLSQAIAAEDSDLRVVESKYVCMVNNKVLANEQIPVEVNGKTYYGCCAMCKAKLERNSNARTAIDPVSNNPVDKATAVIAARPDGSVLYFENEGNFNAYSE